MVTSKLMASKSTSRNSDLRRKTSSPSACLKAPLGFHNQQYTIGAVPPIAITDQEYNSNSELNSMTKDGFLRNVYGDKQPAIETTLLNAEIMLLDEAGAIAPIEEAEVAPFNAFPVVRKTVDDLWREIVEGKREQPPAECKEKAVDEMVTLEDFLVKAGAVEEVAVEPPQGEVKVEGGTERLSGGIFSFDSPYSGASQQSMEGVVGFGNGMEASLAGRGKRKAIMEPLDKATLQRQRRMIKNRESAARSRERKQVKINTC